MKLFIKISLWILIALLPTVGIVLLLTDYDTFCHVVVTITGTAHKEKQFKEIFLPPQKFIDYRYCFTVFSLLFEPALFFMLKRTDQLSNNLKIIGSAIKYALSGLYNFYKDLPITEKSVLGGIIFMGWLSTLYYTFTSPVAVDEALTYLYCTRYSALVSSTYYSLPNNHIFFSILTNVTSILPFSTLINLRISNIFIVLFTNFLFFKYASKFFSNGISLICLSLFTFSFMNFLYSFQARGYELVLATALIVLYSVTKITENGIQSRKYFVYYSIASIIGFYTVPSFLYVFTAITLFGYFSLLWNKRYFFTKQLFISNFIIGCGVLLLYTPVIVINGLKSITANPYTKPISRHSVLDKIIPHFEEIGSWTFGIENGSISLILMVLSVLVLFMSGLKDANSSKIRLLTAVLLSAPILVLLHSVIAFPRTWIFLSIPIFISLGIVLNYFSLSFNKPKVYIPIVTAIIIVQLWSFGQFHRKIFEFDYSMEEAVSKVDISNTTTIGYEDINCADILKYTVVTSKRNKMNIDLLNSDSANCYNADIIVLSHGMPDFISLMPDKYTIVSTSNNKSGILLLKKKI